MNFEIGDERDISLNLLKKEMDALIERGATVFVKFTCQYCFSRQTSDTPNIIHLGGYTCEECGRLTKPDKYGMMIIYGYKFSNKK